MMLEIVGVDDGGDDAVRVGVNDLAAKDAHGSDDEGVLPVPSMKVRERRREIAVYREQNDLVVALLEREQVGSDLNVQIAF
jgi:hypothetical protein